jgi:two-component system phosphate regulon sensor histidine kinase PhoR
MPSSRRLPWALKVGLLGAALTGVGLLAYRVTRAPEIARLAEERLEKDLAGAAAALAAGIGPAGLADPGLDARVKESGRAAGLRFTVVAEDGKVVADSDVPDPRGMEPHGERPEVREAREKGRSTYRRVSASVGRDLRYAAERIPGTRAVARAALDQREAEVLLAEETRFPWVPGLVACAVAGLAAALLLGPTAAGVRRVARAVRGIEEGDLSARVPVRGPDFLRGLSASFNDMAGRLQEDVDRVRAERARLSTVLDGMVEGVVAVDGAGAVRFLNRSARGMLGTPGEDGVEGRPLHEVVRDPHVLALVQQAVDEKEPVEAEVVRHGPPRRLLHVHVAPLREGGPGAILLARDVSALRRLERMRSDFVANVSHELRTPIAAIAGAAETLAEGALSDGEAAPRFVETIGRNAERLRALVDDLLALSRLESAPETIERVPVDLAGVVRQACDAVASRARDAGLALEAKADRSLRVMGDPEALRRVVDNLVVNALTYTPSGGWVRVSAQAQEGRAVLTVADSGIGIAPEHLDRIFERFYRVDKARSRSKGGTGLGLAIVKHGASLHAGDVAVESRVGAGSTFTVTIPLARGEAPPA